MRIRPKRRSRGAEGFTLVELLVAIAILLAGIVTVAEMVPWAMRTNLRNRNDSTALIAAQRLLEQMARQAVDVQNDTCGVPVAPAGHYDYCEGVDAIALGLEGLGVTVAGCALDAANQQLDFTVNCAVAGYTVTKAQVWNPTTGTGQNVELRWRVYTLHDGGGAPVRKVIIIGARAGVPGQGFVVTNLQTVVGR